MNEPFTLVSGYINRRLKFARGTPGTRHGSADPHGTFQTSLDKCARQPFDHFSDQPKSKLDSDRFSDMQRRKLKGAWRVSGSGVSLGLLDRFEIEMNKDSEPISSVLNTGKKTEARLKQKESAPALGNLQLLTKREVALALNVSTRKVERASQAAS